MLQEAEADIFVSCENVPSSLEKNLFDFPPQDLSFGHQEYEDVVEICRGFLKE